MAYVKGSYKAAAAAQNAKSAATNQAKAAGGANTSGRTNAQKATLTPTQQYGAMTPAQLNSFKANNPGVDTANLGPAINHIGANGLWTSNSGSGTFEKATQTAQPDEPTGEGPQVPTDLQQPTETTTTQGGGQEGTLPSDGKKAGPQKNGTITTKVSAGNAGNSKGEYSSFSPNMMQNIAAQQAALQAKGLTEAEIGVKLAQSFAGGSNDVFNKRYAAAKIQDLSTQGSKDGIKEDIATITSTSPDSIHWNKFGKLAQEQEKLTPGYMNDRNKVIADQVMNSNPNSEYMTSAERADAITKVIIARQGSDIPKDIKNWYDETVANINGIINKKIPEITQDQYFNKLINGEDTTKVPTDNVYLVKAKERYNNFKSYDTMSEDGLVDAVSKGTLIQGTQVWNDLVTKGKLEILNKGLNAKSTIVGGDIMDYLINAIGNFDINGSLSSQSGTTTTTNADGTTTNSTPGLNFTNLEDLLSMSIIKDMNDSQLTTVGAALLADPTVQAAKNASRATAAQINTLNQQISDLGDSMKETAVKNGGSDLNTPFMVAEIAMMAKPMIRMADMLQTQYANQIAILTDASDNVKTQFEIDQYNQEKKLATKQMLLTFLQGKDATAAAAAKAEAAAAQQQFENSLKGRVSVSKYGTLDANGKLIPGSKGAATGVGGVSGGGVNTVSKLMTYALNNKLISQNTKYGEPNSTNIVDINTLTPYIQQVYKTNPSASTYNDLGVNLGMGNAQLDSILGIVAPKKKKTEAGKVIGDIGNRWNNLNLF